MLSGDLYHYPQERTLRRAPPDNEFNVAAVGRVTDANRGVSEATKTALWIEHDFNAYAKLKKAPAFYD